MPELVSSFPVLCLAAVLAFLLGSIPFGIVVAKAFGLGDPRNIGSGNIGATNVLRTGNKPAAAITLFLDAGKGGIAVLVARAAIGEDAAQIAGVFAFLGHLFPVYLGFKGGKGVATFFGTLLAMAFPIGIAAGTVWLLTAAILRYSSMSALVAAAAAPLIAFFVGFQAVTFAICVMSLLIFIRHKANIIRLWNGEEPRIGNK